MKIGILTFHWGTNYGAVIQSYALQEYLRQQGHQVEIINYKPRKFDFWFKYLKRPWLLLQLRKHLIAKKKENLLATFRQRMLNQTVRYYSTKRLSKAKFDYDIVISGSDQVLNPSYTLYGEDCPTPAYYLTPFTNSKRIGYAVSFGCNEYPAQALTYSKQWITGFDKIGVREDTGLQILSQMEYTGPSTVVPDPTILMGAKLFDDIQIERPASKNYICAYILRKQITINADNVIYIDDYNTPLSMEQWLGTIIGSNGLITNSYHGMIMAILNHIPFVALADANHMNDRLLTLLRRLDLLKNLTNDIDEYKTILGKPIDWSSVDEKLKAFRQDGISFLDFANH